MSISPKESFIDLASHRVAVIHDWLTGMRGGERVLEAILRLFPAADIFTLIHQPDRVSELINNRKVTESSIARMPFGRSHYRSWLPLFPWAIESFDLKGYDFILSSSHCVAKGVIPPPDAMHISYVHSPMRYVWDMQNEYFENEGFIKRNAGSFAAHYLRQWDVSSSNRVDRFIANSGHVRNRIIKYYRRDATVIHPPVDIDAFQVGSGEGGYFLTASALVPYKRIDLAIMACERLGRPLKILGSGPEYPRLRALAGRMTEFLGTVKYRDLPSIYAGAAAFIHPAEEDFGIAPLEAQAAGRPVIAFGRGGALETIVASGDHPTGAFFERPTVDSLMSRLKVFTPDRFSPDDCRRNALRFAPAVFDERMREYLGDAWTRHRVGGMLT